jgi:hypothetical protein
MESLALIHQNRRNTFIELESLIAILLGTP